MVRKELPRADVACPQPHTLPCGARPQPCVLFPQAQLTDLLSEQRAKVLRLQAELETSEQVQRDFVRLSQALQVRRVPSPRQPGSGWLSRGPTRTAPSQGSSSTSRGWHPPSPGLLLRCISGPHKPISGGRVEPSAPSLAFSWWGQPLPAPAHPGPVSSLESWFTVSWGRGPPGRLVPGPCPRQGWRVGVGASLSHQGPLPPSPDPTGAPGADPPGRKSGASAQYPGGGAPRGRGHLRGRGPPPLQRLPFPAPETRSLGFGGGGGWGLSQDRVFVPSKPGVKRTGPPLSCLPGWSSPGGPPRVLLPGCSSRAAPPRVVLPGWPAFCSQGRHPAGGPSPSRNQRCRLRPAAFWLPCCLLGPNPPAAVPRARLMAGPLTAPALP